MNAMDARELSIKNSKNNDLLDPVIEKIKEVCNNGLFGFIFYFEKEENENDIECLKLELISLGYNVKSIFKEPEFEKEKGKQYTFTMIRGVHVSWN